MWNHGGARQTTGTMRCPEVTGKGQEGAETCRAPCGWCIPSTLPLGTHYSSPLSF